VKPPRDIPAFSYQSRKARPAVDPAMKRMAVGAAGVSVLVIGVALAWSGMRPGMGFGQPPEIHAPAGPLRVAPADPGGLTLPGSDEPIMSGAVSDAAPELAPSGPGPAIAALTAAAAPAPIPAPATESAPAPATASVPASVVPAIALPPPLPPVPPAATTSPAAGGTIQVQLAATGDAAGARRVWAALQTRMPGLFGGKTPLVTPASVAGETIWHLRLGGFTGRAAADRFCDTVISQAGPCTVVGF
jgi:hypothetical protein